MSNIEKIPIIGASLTNEILFGNSYNMPTIWCYQYQKNPDLLTLKLPDLYKLELEYADYV